MRFTDIHEGYLHFYAMVNVNDFAVLFVGGRDANEQVDGSCVAFFVHNQASERWKTQKPLNRRREGLSAIAMPSGIFVYGGHDGTGLNSEIEWLSRLDANNPVEWQIISCNGQQPLPRQFASICRTGANSFIILGGYARNYV